MSDEEILELGPDGSFEIPTPAPVAVQKVFTVASEVDVGEEKQFNSLLERINCGEYKIFQAGEELTVIARMEKGCIPQKCRISEKMLIVDQDNDHKLKIDFPVKVNPKTQQAQFFEEYMIIKIKKSEQ